MERIDKKNVLSLIGLCFTIIAFLTLILPFYRTIDYSTVIPTVKYISSYQLIAGLFNHELAGNTFAILISLFYILFLMFNLAFMIMIILRMRNMKLNKLLIKGFAIANLFISIIIFVLVFMNIGSYSVYDGENLVFCYRVGIVVAVLLISSIYNYIMSFVSGSYKQKK